MTANTANTGNTANTANTANVGNAGVSGDPSGGWFIPDRIDLPFVTEPNPNNVAQEIGELLRPSLGLTGFRRHNWSAKWNAWLAVAQFAGTPWTGGIGAALDADLPSGTPNVITLQIVIEIEKLVRAARDERASALGEILSQDAEFITDFMALLSITPSSHPYTYRVLHVASLIAAFAALHFKNVYDRPRPAQLCPALLPPIPAPGHASFPSGHATQARLMALCILHVLEASTMPAGDVTVIFANLAVLARRIARNREIAGLHYESDSDGGRTLASALFARLIAPPPPPPPPPAPAPPHPYSEFVAAIDLAKDEWS